MTNTFRDAEELADSLNLQDSPVRRIAVNLCLACCIAEIVRHYKPPAKSPRVRDPLPLDGMTEWVGSLVSAPSRRTPAVSVVTNEEVAAASDTIVRLTAETKQLAAILRHDVPYPREEQARAAAFAARLRGAVTSDRPLPLPEEATQAFERLNALADARGEPLPGTTARTGPRRKRGRSLTLDDIARGCLMIAGEVVRSQRELAEQLGVSQPTVQRCKMLREAFARKAPPSTKRAVRGPDGALDVYETDPRIDPRIDREQKPRRGR